MASSCLEVSTGVRCTYGLISLKAASISSNFGMNDMTLRPAGTTETV
ncbi:MAG: hypothetical protein BWY89_01870 [Bacteroidetes bacterium ADurb.BinA012]|nr:MAG: hypothetical protein BWY89_01870 [Bacteroidetes bacterium ADurb.BinA012]